MPGFIPKLTKWERTAMPESEIETLKRIVGNQSVMLHELKEKIQSLASLSSIDSEPVQTWEILQSLSEWADYCDALVLSSKRNQRKNGGL